MLHKHQPTQHFQACTSPSATGTTWGTCGGTCGIGTGGVVPGNSDGTCPAVGIMRATSLGVSGSDATGALMGSMGVGGRGVVVRLVGVNSTRLGLGVNGGLRGVMVPFSWTGWRFWSSSWPLPVLFLNWLGAKDQKVTSNAIWGQNPKTQWDLYQLPPSVTVSSFQGCAKHIFLRPFRLLLHRRCHRFGCEARKGKLLDEQYPSCPM